MNNTHLDQARAWARDNIDDFYEGQRVYAACEVIQSLPDQWVDAEKVQAMIDNYKHARDSNAEGTEGWVINHLMVSNLESLLAPPLPTLADMDEGARHALIGKDVNVERWNNPSMLIAVHKNEGAVLGHNWINPWPFVEVRPLSELSPANGDVPTVAEQENDVPDQAVAKDICNNEEESLPRPEDVPAEEPWIVRSEGENGVEGIGCRNEPGAQFPWLVIRMDGHQFDYCRYCRDSDVTLISRLVPEDKP